MFSEWLAELNEYSRDKSKNFLLKKFLKILLPGHAHKQQRLGNSPPCQKFLAFVANEHGEVAIFLKTFLTKSS